MRGGDRDIGIDHEIPVFREFHRFQLLAHALTPGGEAAHEYRHVGAQVQTCLGELVRRQTRVPQAIQGHQGRGRIGTAAPQSSADGDSFIHADVRAQGTAAKFPEQFCRPDHQVILLPHLAVIAQAPDAAIPRHGNRQLVSQVQELEHGLQQVVAIVPAPGDVQKMVYFCRRRPGS